MFLSKFLILPALFFLTVSMSFAQLPKTFKNSAELDINRFKARVGVHGYMHESPDNTPALEFPKGSGKFIGNGSGLWLSGTDNFGNLFVSAMMFEDDRADFWPGPIPFVGYITLSESEEWAKVWKVNRDEILHFVLMCLTE